MPTMKLLSTLIGANGHLTAELPKLSYEQLLRVQESFEN